MKRTEVLCPECMKGKLIKDDENTVTVTGYCDQCGTRFDFQAATTVRYAKEVIPDAEPKRNGGVRYNGQRCSIHNFGSRKRIQFGDPILNGLTNEDMRLGSKDAKDMPDADNGDIHEWVEVGDSKYGRYMFCLKTKMCRHQTMGEFYGDSDVD